MAQAPRTGAREESGSAARTIGTTAPRGAAPEWRPRTASPLATRAAGTAFAGPLAFRSPFGLAQPSPPCRARWSTWPTARRRCRGPARPRRRRPDGRRTRRAAGARLDEQEDPELSGVGVAQTAAGRVGRQGAARPEHAVGDERRRPRPSAEAEVLEEQQHGDGERVVELDDVDVGRGRCRRRRRQRPGDGGAGHRQVGHLADHRVRVAGAGPEHAAPAAGEACEPARPTSSPRRRRRRSRGSSRACGAVSPPSGTQGRRRW